jgi:lysozyme
VVTLRSRVIGSTVALTMAAGLVAGFEGLRLWAYNDPVGIPTICYGSTSGVRLGQTKTKEECDRLLKNELLVYAAAVDKLVKVPMPDTRRAALISFTYNVGIMNFERSALLRKLNSYQTVSACNEMLRWVYAKGKKLPGLVKRREAERDLCLRS